MTNQADSTDVVDCEPDEWQYVQCPTCGRAIVVFRNLTGQFGEHSCYGSYETASHPPMVMTLATSEVARRLKLNELEFSGALWNLLDGFSVGDKKVVTLGDLASITVKDLRRVRGFGKRRIEELAQMLSLHGLAFQPDDSDKCSQSPPTIPSQKGPESGRGYPACNLGPCDDIYRCDIHPSHWKWAAGYVYKIISLLQEAQTQEDILRLQRTLDQMRARIGPVALVELDRLLMKGLTA